MQTAAHGHSPACKVHMPVMQSLRCGGHSIYLQRHAESPPASLKRVTYLILAGMYACTAGDSISTLQQHTTPTSTAVTLPCGKANPPLQRSVVPCANCMTCRLMPPAWLYQPQDTPTPILRYLFACNQCSKHIRQPVTVGWDRHMDILLPRPLCCRHIKSPAFKRGVYPVKVLSSALSRGLS